MNTIRRHGRLTPPASFYSFTMEEVRELLLNHLTQLGAEIPDDKSLITCEYAPRHYEGHDAAKITVGIPHCLPENAKLLVKNKQLLAEEQSDGE